jgi:hypothetical protein
MDDNHDAKDWVQLTNSSFSLVSSFQLNDILLVNKYHSIGWWWFVDDDIKELGNWNYNWGPVIGLTFWGSGIESSKRSNHRQVKKMVKYYIEGVRFCAAEFRPNGHRAR